MLKGKTAPADTASSAHRIRRTIATIPHAPIRGIEQVAAMPALRDRLATTRLADGRVVRLPPSAVDDGDMVTELTPPPAEARS